MEDNNIECNLESIDNAEFSLNAQNTQKIDQITQTDDQTETSNNINFLYIEDITAFSQLIPTDKTLIEDKKLRYTIYSHLLSLYCYMYTVLKEKRFNFTKKPLINNPDRIVKIDEIIDFRKRIEFSINNGNTEYLISNELRNMMSLLHTFLSNKHKNLSKKDSIYKFFGRLIKNIPNFAMDLFDANTTTLIWYQILIIQIIILGGSFLFQFLLVLILYKRLEFRIFYYIKITLIWTGLPFIKYLINNKINSRFEVQKFFNLSIYIIIYNIIKYINDFISSKNCYKLNSSNIEYELKEDFFDFEPEFQSSAFSIQT